MTKEAIRHIIGIQLGSPPNLAEGKTLDIVLDVLLVVGCIYFSLAVVKVVLSAPHWATAARVLMAYGEEPSLLQIAAMSAFSVYVIIAKLPVLLYDERLDFFCYQSTDSVMEDLMEVYRIRYEESKSDED